MAFLFGRNRNCPRWKQHIICTAHWRIKSACYFGWVQNVLGVFDFHLDLLTNELPNLIPYFCHFQSPESTFFMISQISWDVGDRVTVLQYSSGCFQDSCSSAAYLCLLWQATKNGCTSFNWMYILSEYTIRYSLLGQFSFNNNMHPILGTTVNFIALLLLPVITNYIKISARLG